MRIDAYLAESPLFAVSRAARSFELLTAHALQQDKLNLLEGMVLATLFFEAPKPVKPSVLAETFGVSRGNVSHCLSKLEARGLLQRQIDPNDARVFLLQLKPDGKRAAVRVIAAFDKLQKRFEKRASGKELRSMLATLDELSRAS